MSQKIRDAFTKFIDRAVEKNYGLHSVILMKDGEKAAECFWKPYRPEYNHMLNSLSKSFTSVGSLFAMQEGLLSPDDLVTDIFPGYITCERMKKLKVRHLLTMTTGHESEPDAVFGCEDGVSAFMTSELKKEPGEYFLYNTPSTYMVSAVVKKVTGLPVFEYLRPRLFDKIGISKDVWWESCPRGIPYGGFGFNIKTEDIALFGQFLLNRGSWNGEQLLDPKLIDTATSKQTYSVGGGDWACGYGWQFWICQPRGAYRGDGAFGQYVLVMPEQNAVMAITSGTHDMQAVMTAIWEILLPALNEEKWSGDTLVLSRSLPTVNSDANSQPRDILIGRPYQLFHNPLGINGIRVDSADSITLTIKGEERTIRAGSGEWIENDLGVDTPLSVPFRIMLTPHIAATIGWWNDHTFELLMACTRNAYVQKLNLKFAGDKVNGEFSQNLAGPPINLSGCVLR